MAISAPGVEMEEIRTLERLERLKPEWEYLYEESSATPFQSPGWLIPWWRHFGGSRLWVIALRERGNLTGLAPLFIYKDESGGRRVLFVGTGISDYLDVVTRSGDHIAARTVYEYILGRKEEWDICDLQEIRGASPILKIEGLQKTARVVDQSICMHLELDGSFDGFMGKFSKHRKSIRASLNALKKRGPLVTERAGENDLEEFLESLFRLHQARWRLSGEDGVLADERIQAFHREAARCMQMTNHLRLYRMKLDEKDIAVYYGFKKDRRLYCYLGGYDPEYERFSPGKVLLAYAIQEAIGEGDFEFDFLRGSEEYKYVWRPEVSVNRRITISRGNVL